MRLKTFNARTMSEAMKMVRDHLGEDAIIVSTQKGEGGKGVRLTAALDGADPEFDAAPEPSPLKPPGKKRLGANPERLRVSFGIRPSALEGIDARGGGDHHHQQFPLAPASLARDFRR